MIYFDITDLLEYARSNATLSGIQRVSVLAINRLYNTSGSETLRLIARHPIRKEILSYSARYFGDNPTYNQREFCQHFGLPMSQARKAPFVDFTTYVEQKYNPGIHAWFHRHRLALLDRVTKGATFRKRRIRRGIGSNLEVDPGERVRPRSGDIIFVPGATWNFEKYIDFLRKSSNEGVKIYQFIHDLIPLVTPEHVGDDAPEIFTQWLRDMSQIASGFIANSEATKADLLAYFQAYAPASKPCKVVRLAHEFIMPTPTPQLDGIEPDFLDIKHRAVGAIGARVYNAARVPYVLCVGMIESRKNIWTLVNVWKSLYEELGNNTPRLVFAGRQGQLKEDFDEFLSGTGNLYGFIRIVERPSDSELLYLYQHCMFSVCVSYYEGWGLPIGEALWLGRPVVCSNTSSMPEVGGEFADLVNPHSPESVQAGIRRMIVDADYREARAAAIDKAKLRRWSDVADDLYVALTEQFS